MGEFMASLERLMEIDCKLVIPAHGMPLGDPKRRFREHLEHRKRRESRIQLAYDAGARTVEDLLAQVYDDVPENVLPWAQQALEAHLAKLGITLSDE
jgi:glyoxylase-like metal-dependent hydrolase (beta-lactamase superfamily II)